MQLIFQYVFTGIFLAWLFWSAWLLYRHALGGGAHVQRLQLILNENTARSVSAATDASQAARNAGDAALHVAESNARLVALLESELSQRDKHGA